MAARRGVRRLHAVGTRECALGGAARRALRGRLLAGDLVVGAVLDLEGRGVTVRGFDPASVSGRRIYLHDAESGPFTLAVDDLLA